MVKTYLYKLHGINYKDSLFIQQHFQNKLLEQNSKEQFLLCVNYSDHIFTQGKNGRKHNLLISKEKMEKLKIDYIETDRGGDITYHGPGQIVIYPVFNLKLLKLGVKKYVNRIEMLVSEFLKYYGISSRTYESRPGIWVGESKIASIGINVKRHITKHGFSININNNLSYFEYINPCGFDNLNVTSLQNEIKSRVTPPDCYERLFLLMEDFLGIEITEDNISSGQGILQEKSW